MKNQQKIGDTLEDTLSRDFDLRKEVSKLKNRRHKIRSKKLWQLALKKRSNWVKNR